jgi:tetratricopeptide (TPR) repeat protein
MYLGKAYYYKQKYTNALLSFNSALYLNNKDVNSLYYRALSYIKTNKPDLAYADFKQAESLGHPMAGKAIQHFLKDFKPNETKTE